MQPLLINCINIIPCLIRDAAVNEDVPPDDLWINKKGNRFPGIVALWKAKPSDVKYQDTINYFSIHDIFNKEWCDWFWKMY